MNVLLSSQESVKQESPSISPSDWVDERQDLPIFGADLVGQTHSISAAIADLSPVQSDRQLPAAYQTALKSLPEIQFSEPRALPDWGDIFSDFCLFVRPQTPEEEALFFERVRSFLSLHCQIATASKPLQSQSAIAPIQAGHQHYCDRQRQNDKTRRVLVMSFGEAWADRYMKTMLFDDPAS